jgi:hypothetical protein
VNAVNERDGVEMPNEVRGAEDPPGARTFSNAESPRGSTPRVRGTRASRRAGVTTAITAAAALVLATALAACASTTPSHAASAGGTVTGIPAVSPSPSPSGPAPSPSSAPGGAGSNSATPVTPPSSVNPGGPVVGQLGTPVAQATVIPAGAKYVPIESIGRSSDGRTLYLEIMSQAGACGRYVVVVQESSTQVSVGLAHLPVKVGVMCPMLVRIADFPAHLSAPLGSRTIIDLATGKADSGVGVIPLPLPESGNPADL